MLMKEAILWAIMTTQTSVNSSWQHIWRLSWPIMLANLSQPLVGAADTAMMGHLDDPALIGGVALGTVVIHFLVMLFGFLRMSTTALTSQAAGAVDNQAVQRPLQRGLLIGSGFGLLFILISPLISLAATIIMPASSAVEGYMSTYISIHIFALPALLMNAAMLGWLYGLQSMRLGMMQLLLINGLNIILNFVFVIGFDGGIGGVALASVIANWVGFFFVLFMIRQQFLSYLKGIFSLRAALSTEGWSAYGALSRDIIIRTILLYFVEITLLYAAGLQGDVPLAAIQLIVVIFGLIAYSLDGFAHASEALVGSAIGANEPQTLRQIMWRATCLAGLFSLMLSVLLALAGTSLLSLLTSHDSVIQATYQLWPYVLCLAPSAFLAFQMDGIFIGAAHGRALRNGMIVSFSLFLFSLWLTSHLSFIDPLDGVMIAFIIYLMARGITLVMRLSDILPAKERSL